MILIFSNPNKLSYQRIDSRSGPTPHCSRSHSPRYAWMNKDCLSLHDALLLSSSRVCLVSSRQAALNAVKLVTQNFDQKWNHERTEPKFDVYVDGNGQVEFLSMLFFAARWIPPRIRTTRDRGSPVVVVLVRPAARPALIVNKITINLSLFFPGWRRAVCLELRLKVRQWSVCICIFKGSHFFRMYT